MVLGPLCRIADWEQGLSQHIYFFFLALSLTHTYFHLIRERSCVYWVTPQMPGQIGLRQASFKNLEFYLGNRDPSV